MRRLLRFLGGCLVFLVVLIVLLFAAAYFLSNNAFNEEYDPEVEALSVAIPDDEESIAEGERLFKSRLCAGCHGGDAGGDNVIDEPIMAKLDAPNLTSGKGGVAAEFEEEDWVRAIRHGVGPDGHSLIIMPAGQYQHMSDEELAKIIAYLESAPPVDNTDEDLDIGPIGRVMVVLAGSEFMAAESVLDDPKEPYDGPVDTSAEYGEYLTSLTCQGCHGEELEGVSDPAFGDTPSLHKAGDWTFEEFVSTVREGVRPNGDRLSEDMPWENVAFMTDDELAAIWAFIETFE